MLNRDRPDGGRIPERLHRFSEFVVDDSPLYSVICRNLADNATITEILGSAPYDQPAANLLLAAVQYLLLGGADPQLAAHYPSVTGEATTGSGDAVALFAAFCVRRQEQITQLVMSRNVQTNEVRRCTALMPAFAYVSQQTEKPLALIEIGSSAGLNLLFDRYRYDYGPGAAGGPVESTLLLSTELSGEALPRIEPLPEVIWRRGIDLHPVDVADPAAVRWTRALLWPEQLDRIRRFEAAVAIARSDPPELLAGDALDLLPELAPATPDQATLIVFHSFVLNQFPLEARERLDGLLTDLAKTREVHRIGIEMLSSRDEPPSIRHTTYSKGHQEHAVLGRANHHGAWLEWTA